jgi:two-component system, sensor histidine kinase
VADDNADVRELMAHQLGKLGTDVLMAANGQEAVELALLHRPELVLMDLEMPVVSGLEAVSRLRGGGYQGVIVAFTAHDDGPRTQSAMANGCDAVLKKPLSATKLRTRLVEFLNLRRGGVAA